MGEFGEFGRKEGLVEDRADERADERVGRGGTLSVVGESGGDVASAERGEGLRWS